MKALPLTYAGTQFRSRLEADWAATLDSLDIAWDYEPEGFKLSDGTCYSPDFYLPASKAWLEVKGDHMERVSKVEQFAAELWGEWNTRDGVGNPPLILLGLSPERLGLTSVPYPTLTGVVGPGKRHSVFLARCRACNRWRVTAWEWEDQCVCGEGSFGRDRNAGYTATFIRVPRPVGRGGR